MLLRAALYEGVTVLPPNGGEKVGVELKSRVLLEPLQRLPLLRR